MPGLDNRVIYQPRGKVVGGSSSINAMVFVRGQAGDFDAWAAEGNPGWAWKDLLPLYRRMEDHDLGASASHGTGGPVHVTDISRDVHPLTHRFVQAVQEAGLPFNSDLNGASAEGVGYYQINNARRLSILAARAYLRPALKTGRVRLETGALVTRILFDGRRAVGVGISAERPDAHRARVFGGDPLWRGDQFAATLAAFGRRPGGACARDGFHRGQSARGRCPSSGSSLL